MKIRRLLTLVGAALVLTISTMPAPAGAQELQGWIAYSAKFVCGVQTGVPAEQPVVNGKYRTVINIHNPHYLFGATGAAPLVFFKKAVLALPQSQDPIRPSCHQMEFLDSDHALGVNCSDIRQLFNLTGIVVPNPFDGFLVIEVPPQGGVNETPQLDVTAVYTARHRTGTNPDAADYDVQAIEIEKVTPSRILGDPQQFPCNPDG